MSAGVFGLLTRAIITHSRGAVTRPTRPWYALQQPRSSGFAVDERRDGRMPTKRLEGVTHAVLAAYEPSTFVTSRVGRVEVTWGGIPGDRHFGLTKAAGVRESVYPRNTEILNRRQISVVSLEECRALARNLGVDAVDPEWLGANLVCEGVPDLTRLPAGTRLLWPSGAGLVCEGENRPCEKPGRVIAACYPGIAGIRERFVRAAEGLRGIVCSVERPGVIAAGDPLEVVLRV